MKPPMLSNDPVIREGFFSTFEGGKRSREQLQGPSHSPVSCQRQLVCKVSLVLCALDWSSPALTGWSPC